MLKEAVIDPTFECTDLYLSAALLTIGFKLLDARGNGMGQGVSIFRDRPDRTTIAKQFYSGELGGSFKKYSSNWLDLKSTHSGNLIRRIDIERR